ncbi:RNA polymerase sigma factor [Clostridia bacterium]|nr:RNA polymerase sigma factor [Clostridia bacterium]
MEKPEIDIDAVWENFDKGRDADSKEKLIMYYSYLVKYVAGRLSVHIGQHVEYDDMLSYGIFGLIDAVDKFNLAKGAKFETYASLRIRGSIIDSIRKLDWVPRTLRQKNKQLEGAYAELESVLGREPTEAEISEKLQIPIKEVQDLIKKSSIVSLISLDDYLDQNYETAFAGVNSVRDDENGPERMFEIKETKRLLAEAIDKMSEKEKRVVTLYYYEDLTLKEISVIMGVSESRVSQIHSKALLKLRAKLGKNKALLFG